MNRKSSFVMCSECGKHGRIVVDEQNGPEVASQDDAVLSVKYAFEDKQIEWEEAESFLLEIQKSGLPPRACEVERKTMILVMAWHMLQAIYVETGEPVADPANMHMLARKEKPEWN